MPANPPRRRKRSILRFRIGCRRRIRLQKAIEDWGDDVKKESDGTITYKIFPAQQLGKAFDHYDMARDGIADSPTSIPAISPAASRSSRPASCRFSSATPRAAIGAIDDWYRKYAATEMKDVHYCFSFVLDPVAWHSTPRRSWCRQTSAA